MVASVGKKRRQPAGIASSDVLHSSHTGGNEDLFPRILNLHVEKGARIADVTYGRGVFWKKVDPNDYELHFSDIESKKAEALTGIDARNLPFESEYLDALVFDPPYMEGFYRKAKEHLAGEGTHSAFREHYSNGSVTDRTDLKYHDLVIDIYMEAGREARRVLKDNGTYIVKCQDEVSANRQKLTHVEIIYGLSGLGFYCKDLFVLTRNNKPVVARLVKQEHARKSHSYFLVFMKCKDKLRYDNFSKLIRSYWD